VFIEGAEVLALVTTLGIVVKVIFFPNVLHLWVSFQVLVRAFCGQVLIQMLQWLGQAVGGSSKSQLISLSSIHACKWQ